LIGERILLFNNLHHVILLIKNKLIKMDTFFDLFNKTDLENINKILITENEKDKVFKIYKNLKDSIYLAQIAEEIKNIKRRYLINQIGGARPNTRSVSAQNQVLNAPVSSGTCSRSSQWWKR